MLARETGTVQVEVEAARQCVLVQIRNVSPCGKTHVIDENIQGILDTEYRQLAAVLVRGCQKTATA